MAFFPARSARRKAWWAFATTATSVATALTLLIALTLLSFNEHEETYRRIDQTLAHLHDLVVTTGREVNTSIRRGRADESRLVKLDAAIGAMVAHLDGDIGAVYGDNSSSGARDTALRAFNAIDGRLGEPTASSAIAHAHARLTELTTAISDSTRTFVAAQQEYSTSLDTMRTTGRTLGTSLLDRGLESQGELIFNATHRIIERIERDGSLSGDPISAISRDLKAQLRSMSASDRRALEAALAQANRLPALRTTLDASADAVDTANLAAHIDALREQVSRDHIYQLATSADARVLLNVYTALLLAILAYFGFRLKRSHSELNRSHDDLEQRVSERTRDLKLAYEDLKESQVQLVQAEKMSSLGQLIAGVMHEINTPLLYVHNNAIVTTENVESLREYVNATIAIVQADKGDLDELAAGLRAYLDSLDCNDVLETIDEVVGLNDDSVQGLDQISELVMSLKDFSRLDRAAEESFDVREGIIKTLVITRNLLKTGIEVVEDLKDVPAIQCAPSRINQVFINLVTNAAHAMDGNGRLEISTTPVDDTWIEIKFKDNGCGISEEHIEKIMDPFFTTKPTGKGTGLGLSIVKRIVDEHGGEIHIDSKAGVGTQVRLILPVRPQPQKEAA